jgi:5'-3' exonuclease
MGIPSYFSYIIKHYSNIIRNRKYFNSASSPNRIHHLFMDCNSIIYDCVNSIIGDLSTVEFESLLIENVIKKIEKYIIMIQPIKSVFIAFDGVAPFAKMNQQRTRRYKTAFLKKIFPPNTNKWNTTAITPGTEFMKKLSSSVKRHFEYRSIEYSVAKIVFSGSDEPGEGEHKLFKELRTGIFDEDEIAVYGLDADLFMLSIFHLNYCKNIYVFREAPEFLKNSIPVEENNGKNDPFFIDISNLAFSISKEMDCKFAHPQRIFDYVFLCFFLGNDFLPHFPAMNIRTHGIQIVLDIYRSVLGNFPDRFLISIENGNIEWKLVGLLVGELAKREHQLLLNEYFVRDKFDRRSFKESTQNEKEEFLENIPIVDRAIEKYIHPQEDHWESRYYRSLFDFDYGEEKNIKALCLNYIEGLEWVFKYYTEDCPDWNWKYNYHYPPLFSQLFKYIPHFQTEFISNSIVARPFHPYTQLAYVLPKDSLDILPLKIKIFLLKNYPEFYPEKYSFEWAFCRYFWESHPNLPSIDSTLLKQIDVQFSLFEEDSAR